MIHVSLSLSFLKIVFIFKRVEGKEKERERNINVWLPPPCSVLGTWPMTQACALVGNGTSDPLVCRLVLNPLSHTSQGQILLSCIDVSLSLPPSLKKSMKKDINI